MPDWDEVPSVLNHIDQGARLDDILHGKPFKPLHDYAHNEESLRTLREIEKAAEHFKRLAVFVQRIDDRVHDCPFNGKVLPECGGCGIVKIIADGDYLCEKCRRTL